MLSAKSNAFTYPTTAAQIRRERDTCRLWLAAILLVMFALWLPLSSQAQTNYVYVNGESLANSVSGFSVSPTGALKALAGSPFLTGGVGATVKCYGLDRIIVSAANHAMFVSNTGDQTISAFQINPASGSLTAAPGSPYASGLTLDSCQGMSLAATPDGHFLMASSNGQINTFAIAADGSLTPAATTTNCCSPMDGMKISSNGQLLAVSNEVSVSVYTVNLDGSLTAVLGSPFAKTGLALLAGLEFNCSADRLYGTEGTFASSTITDAWSVAANGALSPLAGSPFTSSGTDANTVLLSPDNTLLFESDQFSNSITSFAVLADGSLTRIGSFGGVNSLHVPVGMATDRSGTFLYVADDGFGLAVFRIDGGGILSPLHDLAIPGAQEIQGLTAYPPRSCTTADFAITKTASPITVPVGTNVTYTVTITNNGPDAASAVITDSLPSSTTFVSCVATGGGVCGGSVNHRTVTFSSLANGQTETVTIVAQTSSKLINGASIANTASVSNSSAVDPNPANNSATATVTIVAPAVASTLTVASASGPYGGSAILSATLKRTSDGSPAAGKSVTFSLNGVAMGSALTNATGVASIPASLGATPVGTHPGAVSASFAGDPTLLPSSGTAGLVVNRGVLTVMAAHASRVYGDANPAFIYTISGFAPGDTAATVVSGIASCTSAATPASAVGTYPIVCDVSTLSATNYTFITLNGTLSVTPAPLTATADNASRLYGDPNPAFTGTITGLKNGDNITATYASATDPTSPAGTYAIVPTLVDPGSKLSNYTVVSNNGTLTVNPAPLTVTAANAGRVYGDPNPAFTGTITGLKNGDNITASYASPATVASPAGTYAIIPTLVDPTNKLGNYSVTSNNGTLSVGDAILTVIAASVSRFYGDPNLVFTGTITGIKNADNITATYSTTATAASPVGTYAIVPTLVDPTAKLGSYTVVSNNGTLTVGAAPLTITAANVSRLYGDPNPAFTGTITGLKNGDTITATYASTATSASPVGAYAIVATLLDPAGQLSNYAVTSNNGTLTVNPAPLTVTIANASRLYGDPNPAFSGTITGLKNGDNITATYSSIATPASSVGTYSIIPTLVDAASKLGNYTVTIINGTLTVLPAPLTVTAANATRRYGDLDPPFTGTIVGIKNNDNITATYASTATRTSPVGTYPIIPTLVDPTGKLSNYIVTIKNGTLTITASPLTVTAADANRPFGAPNPVFTGTISGLKNGDNITATYSTAATQASPVGTYPIVPTLVDPAGKLGNYTVTSINGTLTITVALATISSPANGTTLTSGTTTFTWTSAPGATSYQLWVGTTLGASDLALVTTSGLSATVTGLPINGVPLFVRLSTFTGGAWFFNSYTYTAANVTIAAITSPANGATLKGNKVTFKWTAAPGATSYQVWVGTTLGAHDLAAVTTSKLSATVSGLPTNGSPLFVRMWTFIGGVSYFNSYTYTTGP